MNKRLTQFSDTLTLEELLSKFTASELRNMFIGSTYWVGRPSIWQERKQYHHEKAKKEIDEAFARKKRARRSDEDIKTDVEKIKKWWRNVCSGIGLLYVEENNIKKTERPPQEQPKVVEVEPQVPEVKEEASQKNEETIEASASSPQQEEQKETIQEDKNEFEGRERKLTKKELKNQQKEVYRPYLYLTREEYAEFKNKCFLKRKSMTEVLSKFVERYIKD